ncbi:MAG: hypothetical protein MPJ50_03630 [Pirellulales bacterium]|nr:hypothetical protein [Pirellulales bacterium]
MPSFSATTQAETSAQELHFDRFPLRPCEQESLLDRVHASFSACGLARTAERIVLSINKRGILRIDGRVSSYYLKQLVQEIALRFPSIEQVENRLVVSRQRKLQRKPLTRCSAD